MCQLRKSVIKVKIAMILSILLLPVAFIKHERAFFATKIAK